MRYKSSNAVGRQLLTMKKELEETCFNILFQRGRTEQNQEPCHANVAFIPAEIRK
jgi:hypothetical protein